MLDVSRGKVLRLETLCRLVDRLSEHGYNHLQLYGERSFDYGEATPPPFLRADEVRRLDGYCAAKGLELAANQNSLGHMERWLTDPHFRDLAELPDGGALTPWGTVQEEPTGLRAASAEALEFLGHLYDRLLPNFNSKDVNVGCDEVFDLGKGRSQSFCREVGGEGELFLRHIEGIAALLARHGKRPLLWADMILKHPEIAPRLPEGTIALVWGYEADHPFREQCRILSESGVEFWVAPGTSSWRSFAGRSSNMAINVRRALESGREFGATGMLLCDWGDAGHAQPIDASYPAIAYAAALARGQGMDTFRFSAEERSWFALGDAYRALGVSCANSTALFRRLIGLSTPPFDTQAMVREVRLLSPEGVDCEAFELARDLMLWAAGERIDGLEERYRRYWLKYNQPAGLEESLRKMRLA